MSISRKTARPQNPGWSFHTVCTLGYLREHVAANDTPTHGSSQSPSMFPPTNHHVQPHSKHCCCWGNRKRSNLVLFDNTESNEATDWLTNPFWVETTAPQAQKVRDGNTELDHPLDHGFVMSYPYTASNRADTAPHPSRLSSASRSRFIASPAIDNMQSKEGNPGRCMTAEAQQGDWRLSDLATQLPPGPGQRHL